LQIAPHACQAPTHPPTHLQNKASDVHHHLLAMRLLLLLLQALMMMWLLSCVASGLTRTGAQQQQQQRGHGEAEGQQQQQYLLRFEPQCGRCMACALHNKPQYRSI
jgi:hypothetical protein